MKNNRESWQPPNEFFNSDIDLKKYYDAAKEYKNGYEHSHSILELKPSINHEKGVVVYREPLYLYARLISTCERELMKDIHILEPRWSYWIEMFNSKYSLLPWLRDDYHIIFMVHTPQEKQYFDDNQLYYIYPFGAGCWISKEVFKPINNSPKKFDLMMVAGANMPDKVKNWSLLLHMSKSLNLKVLLLRRMDEYVNYENEIKPFQLINQLKIDHLVTVINCELTREQMNLFYNQSRFTCVFSKKEGFNRSLVESLHANTPVLLLENSISVPAYCINEETGFIICPEHVTTEKWNYFLNRTCNMSPRDWSLKNITAEVSTAKLNQYLEQYCFEKNLVWKSPINIHYNNPRKVLK